MLSNRSKQTIAINILTDSLKSLNELSANNIERFNNFDDFFQWVKMDYEYIIGKAKFIYYSFEVLHDNEDATKIIEAFDELYPVDIFTRFGQPSPLPNFFIFEKFRYQTKEELKRSNEIALEILKEL